VSDVAKIKALEDENSRLKRIDTDRLLQIDVLKIVNSGKFRRLNRTVEPCRAHRDCAGIRKCSLNPTWLTL
jgi:hypothetical protein